MTPFGEGNPKPVFLLPHVTLREVSWFGKSEEHLKLAIERHFDTVEAVAFFAKRDLGKKLNLLEKGRRVNLLVNLERDQFSRRGGMRLRIGQQLVDEAEDAVRRVRAGERGRPALTHPTNWVLQREPRWLMASDRSAAR